MYAEYVDYRKIELNVDYAIVDEKREKNARLGSAQEHMNVDSVFGGRSRESSCSRNKIQSCWLRIILSFVVSIYGLSLSVIRTS